MNYSKLAEESSKMFEAFRQAGWNDEWAYELSKTCIREFPVFREMVEEERTPEQVIGYVYFVNGDKEPIYHTEKIANNAVEFRTSTNNYIISEEYDAFLLRTTTSYSKLNPKSNKWEKVYNIKAIEVKNK